VAEKMDVDHEGSREQMNVDDEDDMEDMDGKAKALTNLLKTSSVSDLPAAKQRQSC
jgi:hypothetical protein